MILYCLFIFQSFPSHHHHHHHSHSLCKITIIVIPMHFTFLFALNSEGKEEWRSCIIMRWKCSSWFWSGGNGGGSGVMVIRWVNICLLYATYIYMCEEGNANLKKEDAICLTCRKFTTSFSKLKVLGKKIPPHVENKNFFPNQTSALAILGQTW